MSCVEVLITALVIQITKATGYVMYSMDHANRIPLFTYRSNVMVVMPGSTLSALESRLQTLMPHHLNSTVWTAALDVKTLFNRHSYAPLTTVDIVKLSSACILYIS